MKEPNRFGITLKRLNSDMLEMVRVWRNSDDVRPYMQYQEIISQEQQQSWFENMDKLRNYYFVAFNGSDSFGVYNIKDIDLDGGYGECGVFLKDRSFWEGDLAIRGSILNGLFAFETLNLNYLNIHVLKANKPAVNYNLQLGFEPSSVDEDSTSLTMTLTKKGFLENPRVVKLINYLDKIYGKS